MADLQGRKVFKVFNQDFIVDERYTVTKELGQGAYGIVWYEPLLPLLPPLIDRSPRLATRSWAITRKITREPS